MSDSVQQLIIDALQPYATAIDKLFPICAKIAYLILVTALCTTVWGGRGGHPAQLVWKLLACCFVVTAIANWGDWVKPKDGLFSQIGQGIAAEIDQQAGLGSYEQMAQQEIKNSQSSWTDIYGSLKYTAYQMLDLGIRVLTLLTKILQYALLLLFYGLGPIFLAFLCIQTTTPIGKKFLFIMAGFYWWDVIWKLVDIIALGILHFGGFTNFLLYPLASIWLIAGYILGPVFGTKLFTAGHTGISHMAGSAAMRFGTRGGYAAGGRAVGSLKAAGAALAAIATGGTAAVATAGVKTAAASPIPSIPSTSSDATATKGALGVGETAKVGKAAITRTSPNTFSMDGSEHNGDPNSASDLARALHATTFSSTEKATIRTAMSARQKKNQQVAEKFPV